MTTAAVKWDIEADYLQACNCDFGCPCEFSAPPTLGYCEGMGVWRIQRGGYGETRLENLCFGFLARWPKQIHEGNGTVALFFDERANSQQREALLRIATGQAGGLPFEILATTFTTLLEPRYVPIEFSLDGPHSAAKLGHNVRMAFEPIKNPVTGSPEVVRVNHATGFVFKEADCAAAKEFSAEVDGLKFSWPNKAAFFAKVSYGN